MHMYHYKGLSAVYPFSECLRPHDKKYLSINSVRTNAPTLCPLVWLPYVHESVEKTLSESHVAFVLGTYKIMLEL